MQESSQAREAYAAYLALGTQRSTAKVAQQFGKSKRLIDRWCGAHGWVERIAAHERTLAAEREAEDAEKRRKLREARIGVAVEMQTLGLKALRSAERITPYAAVQMIHEAHDTQRRDLGEADQRVEVSGPDGRDITVRVIYDDSTAAADPPEPGA